ncbi:MAG TPA: hypothetical protein VME41_09855 [Stellaceae bacterium]|nr:hypothetical protein [Stellaceae bacterium]
MLFGVVALFGCSWVSSVNPFSSGSSGSAATCPTATILAPLAHTAVFAPGRERTPIGVAFYGILDDVSAKCDFAGGAVHVALDVIVIGERGPAASGGTAVNFNYFVAVTGPGEALLSKRTLPVTVAIPPDKKRAGVTDHIDEAIPLAGLNPAQLTIDLGFQQSPDVVDFYRHFRGD